MLSDWRKLVCASGLKGLEREIVVGSELVEFDEAHALLRPLSLMLVNEEAKRTVQRALEQAAGHEFRVLFTHDERAEDAVSISLIEEAERRAARLALIEAFKSDPFVQQCLTALDGTLDETSVEPSGKDF